MSARGHIPRRGGALLLGLLPLALLAVLALPCRAEAEIEARLGAERASESLPAGAEEALSGLSVGEAELDEGLGRIFAMVEAHGRAAAAEALRPALSVVAAALLCALAEPLALREAGRFDYVGFAGCLAVAAATASDVQGVIALGSETVRELDVYTKSLLPVLATAATAAGAPVSAGAKYAAAALFSDLLLTAAERLVLPMLCGYVAVAAAGAALGTGQLGGAAALLKWCATRLLLALAGAFTGYLTLTGVLSGGTDAAASKAARSALSAALPVVGRTLSDAAEALTAGAALVRNAIGTFGLLAVLAAVALPALRIGARYLLYKGAAALSSAVAGPRLGGLISALGSACGMMLGLVGTAAAIHFLAVVSLLRTVAG